MRSLFWRIFATFWIATALVAGLSLLLGHALKQDAWILTRHPGIKNLAENWTRSYEQDGPEAAQELLEQYKRRHHIDTQVLRDNGQPAVRGTFPFRAAAFEAYEQRRNRSERRLPWRRLSEDYVSPTTGENFLFIYRIPHPELDAWQHKSLLWPISALLITLLVLIAMSLLLTLYITRPLNRLRSAVHDLGQTAYQQHSLRQLSGRRDELGLLARDFNRMGARLQGLLVSQRQLLRDVSHELRSPLARLRVALALVERADEAGRQKLWPRLDTECDRLERLIGEILSLARADAAPGAAAPVSLRELMQQLANNMLLAAPEQKLNIQVPDVRITAWAEMLERAFDNLLRNAVRFNPPGQPIEIHARIEGPQLKLRIRDHGPGASESDLAQLGTPFYRAADQASQGHGLGLAIARRAIERHGGTLTLSNATGGGFQASIELPLVADEGLRLNQSDAPQT